MDMILDLDLDFFVWPVVHNPTSDQAPESDFSYIASDQMVRDFLEHRCHLSRNNKIPGRQIIEHVEAFNIWQSWIQTGLLSNPFRVVHVDAHADLGAGLNKTCSYIESELLALPLNARSSSIRFGDDGINSGNYLLAAIACRLVAQLTYVYPTDPNPSIEATKIFEHVEKIRKLTGNFENEDDNLKRREIAPCCFQNEDLNKIQLAYWGSEGFTFGKQPISLEPAIPFEMTSVSGFDLSGFTHMIVAESPQYAPRSASRLLPIIGDYFAPV